VVRENDRLWQSMGKVRRRRIAEESPLPAEFVDDVAALRHDTMTLVHTSEEISDKQAKNSTPGRLLFAAVWTSG
jgi:hypothetical protein